MIPKFRFVCATRGSSDQFFTSTPLGRSLAIYNAPFAELTLFDNNKTGLPKLYNEAITDSVSDPAILVFVHDDVHLCDFFWHQRIVDGLEAFDIIGVAGNRRRLPKQPTWGYIDENFTWDDSTNLSGAVAHGSGFPPTMLSSYGASAQEVKLLDGLFLAARSETILANGIRFDEQFDFHFYDMDFCRQAETKSLRMGTWPLSLIHESPGHAATPAWRTQYAKYLQKWGG
jgi:hypothetical protein